METNGLQQRPMKRDGMSMLFVLARKNLTELLERLVKERTFKVKLDNDQQHLAAFQKISQQLTVVGQKIGNIKINPQVDIKVPETKITLNNTHDEKLANKIDRHAQEVGRALEQVVLQFVTLSNELEKVQKAVSDNKTVFPATQNIQGSVKVTDAPKIPELAKMEAVLREIKMAIGNIHIEVPKQQDIKIPEMPKSMSITEGKQIIKALTDVTKKLDELPDAFPSFDFPHEINVGNFPPQHVPTPVTHISLNSLAGTTKSRAITVGTTPTPLPDEVLAYRRSLVVYNNSNQTLYVGGSDVSTTNGMIVPATSYSPAFDSGPKMIVYGIVATGTANVRTLEASDENSGR